MEPRRTHRCRVGRDAGTGPGRATAARAVLGLALAALALLLPAQPATAHASLLGTAPEDGTTLQAPPDEITLFFSEHVDLDATRIAVIDGHGDPVALADVHVVASHPGDAEAPVQVVGRLPHLAADTYRVSWETVSGDDLHESSGSFAFGVQVPAQAIGGSHDDAPAAQEVLARWALLLGMALALGGLLVRSVLTRSAPTRSVTRFGAAAPADVRALRLSLVGSLTALLASGLLLLVQVTSGGVAVHDLLAGSYGLRWFVRESGLALLALAVLAVLRGARSRLLVLGGGALTCLGTALLGHGAASATRVVATSIHLAAALTWAGAVACLALLVATRARPSAAGGWAGPLRSFGTPAAACVGVMVVSGVYLSSGVVDSVDAVLSSFYGRTLLVKVGVAGLAGAVGLVNHRRLRGHRADLPRRTLTAEAAVLVTVVAVTAVLTSAAPAHAEQTGHLDVILRGLAGVLATALAVASLVAVRTRRRGTDPAQQRHGAVDDHSEQVPT